MCINDPIVCADVTAFQLDMVWKQECLMWPQGSSDNPFEKDMNRHTWDVIQHYHGKLVPTGCPSIYCSALPTHHRSNKSLRNPFKVVVMDDVPDGTIVTVKAGNDENCCAEIKNYTAPLKDQVATFNDIRFIGRSGRGTVYATIVTN